MDNDENGVEGNEIEIEAARVSLKSIDSMASVSTNVRKYEHNNNNRQLTCELIKVGEELKTL